MTTNRNGLFVFPRIALWGIGMAMCVTNGSTPESTPVLVAQDEAAQIADITRLIAGSVDFKFKEAAAKNPGGKVLALRDAHPKAHGCVTANFIVNKEQLAPRLRYGVFDQRDRYPAWIRFSNGSQEIRSDMEADVRGMAIKLMGVEGSKLLADESDAKTQDFLLVNSPIFFSATVPDYLEFTRAAVTGKQQEFFSTHMEARAALARMRQSKMDNPLTSRYWSQVPYKLGPSFVKYSARSCSPAPATTAGGSNENFLRDAMASSLGKGSACFDFLVQFQTDPAEMPLENPMKEWDESKSPFIKVATVEIPQQSFDSKDRQETCENLSFTPWHSLSEHEPVGAINRVRKAVYQAVSKSRHEKNNAVRQEP